MKRFLACLLAFLLLATAAEATVSTTSSTTTVEGNSVTTSFAYGFPIPAASQVVVSVLDTTVTPNVTTVLTPNQYVITGICGSNCSNSRGGAVTYPLSGPPLASGLFITISRIVPLIQTVSIRNQGPTFASIENALDYLTYITQQITNGNTSISVSSVNGVAYPANPATNTVPVVTSPNQVTYEALPLSAMATIGAGTVLGNTGAIPSVPSATVAPVLGPGGSITLKGASSGSATIGVPTAAGAVTLTLPNTNGSNGNVLSTDGAGNLSWTASSGAINAGTTGQLGYYAASGTTLSGTPNASISTGTLTLGTNGSVGGGLALAGSISGTVSLKAPASAGSNTITLPAGTTDFSVSGGTSEVLKQTSAGAAFTVARLACADLSDSTTACSTAIGTSGATLPLLNGNNTWTGTQSFNSSDLILKGATSGTITLNAAGIAGTNTITLPAGTTDFSATGGTSQVVKQASVGGALTVARLACADLSDATLCSATTPLAVASGGTGLASGTSGGVLAYTGSGTLASSGVLTANLPVIGGGAGVAPTVGTRSGNTTEFGTVSGALTSGNCIKSDASGNLIDAAATCGGGATGALVFLASASASTSTSIDFTSSIDSTYDEYVFELVNLIPATDNVTLGVRVEIGGSFKTDFTYAYGGFISASSLTNQNVVSAQQFDVAQNVGDAATDGLSGTFVLYSPAATGIYKKVRWQFAERLTSTPINTATGGGGTYTGAAGAITGIRFFMESGNITSGTIRMYGVSKS